MLFIQSEVAWHSKGFSRPQGHFLRHYKHQTGITSSMFGLAALLIGVSKKTNTKSSESKNATFSPVMTEE